MKIVCDIVTTYLESRMSVAELVVSVSKPVGSAIGFTLVKDSCTVAKIIDSSIASEFLPGDVILSINGIQVSENCVRTMLRDCRNLDTVLVSVARTSCIDQENLDIPISPATRNGCLCFSSSARKPVVVPDLPLRNRSNQTNDSMPGTTQKRASSVGSASSPKMFGSVSSMSSAGMRPVDLRKLTKEGAGTMWMVGRGSNK